MNSENLDQINRMIEEKGADIADEIYEVFFNKSEELARIFRNSDLDKQKSRLIEGLETIVALLGNEQELVTYLEDLGVRHLAYEVEPEHYPLIEASLVEVLAKFADPYNIDVNWQQLGALITSAMRSGTVKLNRAI